MYLVRLAQLTEIIIPNLQLTDLHQLTENLYHWHLADWADFSFQQTTDVKPFRIFSCKSQNFIISGTA